MSTHIQAASLQGLRPGTQQYFACQRELIMSRPALRRIYEQWYRALLADADSVPGAGAILELGSGGSFLKSLRPEVITSDVTPGVAEQTIDARELPFRDGSLRAILMTHSFHHIPQVGRFLAEAQRSLAPGGVISMIEPSHTPLARLLFSRFHDEPYDDWTLEWDFQQHDSMQDSNQALSWIVFFRDRKRFASEFPELRLESWSWLPWFSYILSGGVTKPDRIPHALQGLMPIAEWLLTPLRPAFAIHWRLTIRKQMR